MLIVERWTGPTTCASGTCTVSNAYYSKLYIPLMQSLGIKDWCQTRSMSTGMIAKLFWSGTVTWFLHVLEYEHNYICGEDMRIVHTKIQNMLKMYIKCSWRLELLHYSAQGMYGEESSPPSLNPFLQVYLAKNPFSLAPKQLKSELPKRNLWSPGTKEIEKGSLSPRNPGTWNA